MTNPHQICADMDRPMKRTAPPLDGICPKCHPPTFASGGAEFGIHVNGMTIVHNPSIPEGEIHLRDPGMLIGKVINFN